MNFQNPSSMPSAAEIKQPSLLAKVTLKDYQLRGLNWLANLYEQVHNVFLFTIYCYIVVKHNS